MEYMGEFNLLEWTGDYFIQVPSGLKEKGLKAETIMEIVRETLTAKEIKQLGEMESLSASFPLKKKTAKEVIKGMAKEAADQGMSFLVDSLIEATFDINMSTDVKSGIFTEIVKMIMDEEERTYIASIGKYNKDQLFFESVIPTSELIQSFFKTEYEADFFVAHIAVNTFEMTGDFVIEDLETIFEEATPFLKQEEVHFNYKAINYPLQVLSDGKLSYNMFTMTLELEKRNN